MTREHIHFVTGKLAEPSLRRVVAKLSDVADFDFTIDVLGISVAALLTPAWIAKRIGRVPQATQVLLPGYCGGDLSPVEKAMGLPVARGPKDLRDLPTFFGHRSSTPSNYGAWDIEILAEINHAPKWRLDDLLQEADRLRQDGADLIDVGCVPGEVSADVRMIVQSLTEAGHRVSIDSMDPREIEPALAVGAELVLSVNSTNREIATGWDCEVIVVPDVPGTLEGIDQTIDMLKSAGVRYRIDGILDPIGFGFAASLGRYLEIRRRWPDDELMMGVGNLTELTDVDTAGVNVLLLGFCQEVGIRSVLTTQVISWAQTAVKEIDVARQLAHHAVREHTLPKHLDSRLIMLRDEGVPSFDADELERLALAIRDKSLRVFADEGRLHVVAAGMHLESADAYALFEQIERRDPSRLDPSHAFYLGYELAKATTAITLGKRYVQDEAIDWGMLTRGEGAGRRRVQEGNNDSEPSGAHRGTEAPDSDHQEPTP